MPDMDRLRAFAAAKKEKANADAESKKAGRIIADLEAAILEEFASEGIPKITVDVVPETELADRLRARIEGDPYDAQSSTAVALLADALAFVKEHSQEPFSMTLSVGSRIWAKPKVDDPERDKASDAEYERACRALEAHGFGDFVQERFNVISLSSAIKEEVELGRLKLGDNFDGTIVIEEKFQVNARKAAGS